MKLLSHEYTINNVGYRFILGIKRISTKSLRDIYKPFLLFKENLHFNKGEKRK